MPSVAITEALAVTVVVSVPQGLLGPVLRLRSVPFLILHFLRIPLGPFSCLPRLLLYLPLPPVLLLLPLVLPLRLPRLLPAPPVTLVPLFVAARTWRWIRRRR